MSVYLKLYYFRQDGSLGHCSVKSAEADEILDEMTEYVIGVGRNQQEMREDIEFTREYLREKGLLPRKRPRGEAA